MICIQSWTRKLLVGLHIISTPDVISEYIGNHPSYAQLQAGKVLIVRNNSILKWACLRCPGGCGEKIMLRLSAKQKPYWQVQNDWLGRPTIYPSVWQRNQCGCHFWIRDGQIQWDKDGRPVMRSIQELIDNV